MKRIILKRTYTSVKYFVGIVILCFLVSCTADKHIVNTFQLDRGNLAYKTGNELLMRGSYEYALIKFNEAYSFFLLSGSEYNVIASALKNFKVATLLKNVEVANEWLAKAKIHSAASGNKFNSLILIAEISAYSNKGEYDKVLDSSSSINLSNLNDDQKFETISHQLKASYHTNKDYSEPFEKLAALLPSQYEFCIRKEHSNPLIVSAGAYLLASISLDKKNLLKGIDFAQMAADIDLLFGFIEGSAEDNLLLAKLYNGVDDTKAKAHYLRAREFFIAIGQQEKANECLSFLDGIK